MSRTFRPLSDVLKNHYVKYVAYLAIAGVIATAITLGISYHFKSLQQCHLISNKISFLNDIFAREVIIQSTDTLNFELGRLKTDYNLTSIGFSTQSNSEFEMCSPYSLTRDFEHPIKFGDQILGVIKGTQGPIPLFKFDNLGFFIPLFAMILISFMFISSLKRILESVFFIPITAILDQADSVEPGKNEFSYKGDIKEFEILKEKLNSMLSRINLVSEKNLQLEKAASLGEMAAQVAHDIRSPLEALKSLRDDLKILPESSRQRISLSINRIEEVSFNLLRKNRINEDFEKFPPSEELISLVESIVAEKSIEFRQARNVSVSLHLPMGETCQFSKIHRGKLRSILSNIINNARDSFANSGGMVEVSIYSLDNSNTIEVRDNGPGIDPSVKSQLFTKGFTTKEDGNGLGLFNARKDIEFAGGSLTFKSELGKGSTFSICLPKSNVPSTFVSEIPLYQFKSIVILDDDPSFHEVWKDRLRGTKLPILHYLSTEALLKSGIAFNSHTLLLNDYETMEDGFNGIDTILGLNHAPYSILVTARSEEQKIHERCLKHGIRILPKSMLRHTPIIESLSTVILIDDDRLTHLSWNSFFSSKNTTFHSFFSVTDFLQHKDSFTHDSIIFIDCDLGEGGRGEIESQKIYELGFSNLHLSTGYSADSITVPTWIKGVHSKNPAQIEFL